MDLHQGEGLQDVDPADVGPGDAALVGQGPHDRAGLDVVATADLDPVDGARALLVAPSPAGCAGLALEAVPTAPAAVLPVAPALEGGGDEVALGVEVLLAAPPRTRALLASLAPLALLAALAAARPLVAHGQGEQGGGQGGLVNAQLGGLGVHEVGVHGQAPALVAGGGPLQQLAGAVEGDVGRRGQGDLLQAGAGQALDLAELALLLGGQEGDGLAVAAGAAGAADAVDVGLGLAGHVEVDHQADAVHVQSAGGHVGGHEHVEGAGAQALDEALALALGHVAGDGGRLDAAPGQLDGDVLGRGLGAHEHDGGLGVGDGQDAGDGADLVAEGDDGVGLVDGVDRGGLGGDLDPDGVGQVLAGHALDGRRHGRAEQGGAPLLGQGGGDGLDVLGEAHAQHLVGLVEDEVRDVVQDQGALVDEVDNAPGRADDDLGAVAQRPDLRAVGGAAVDGDDVQAARAVGHVGDGVGALEGQLAGGRQDQGLDDGLAGVDGVEQGQAEGGGLAGAGLRDADDVAPGQQDRDGLALDVGGRHVAHVGDGPEQVGGQAQVGEGGLPVRLGVGPRPGGLVLVGVGEGRVAVDVLLVDLGVVGAVVGLLVLVLRVPLVQGQVDVVGLVLVLDPLGVLGGVGGGGRVEGGRGDRGAGLNAVRGGQVLGGVGVVDRLVGGGRLVGVRVSRPVGVGRLSGGQLSLEEVVEAQRAVGGLLGGRSGPGVVAHR